MPEPPNTPVNDNAPRGRCPICGKPTVAASRPFCSQRCKDVDLHRWFSGQYSTPALEEEGGGETAEAGEDKPPSS